MFVCVYVGVGVHARERDACVFFSGECNRVIPTFMVSFNADLHTSNRTYIHIHART
jgi:hypothetical protein